MSSYGALEGDPQHPGGPAVGSDPWADDPFADAGLDASEDEELYEFLHAAEELTAAHTARHQLASLSALSAQMGRYPVLNAAEQERRIEMFQGGLAAAAILAAGGRIGSRQRHNLERAVMVGEQAQTELVGSMFRLVLVITRELAGKRYGMGKDLAELPDLVAEANTALVEAIATFDPGRGPSFSVYSARKVRERVRLMVSSDSPMKVPASWSRLRRLATTLAPDLAAQLGRTPTPEEMQAGLLRQCMAWAADHLTDAQLKLDAPVREELMKAKLLKQGMLGAIERYEEVMVATQQMWNLDAPVGTDSGTRLGDMVAEAPSDAMFDTVELSELRTALLTALGDLPDRDREIILYRFGFADGEVWTYAKLAPRYSISAERIRQIERSVLAKLRGPGFDSLAEFQS